MTRHFGILIKDSQICDKNNKTYVDIDYIVHPSPRLFPLFTLPCHSHLFMTSPSLQRNEGRRERRKEERKKKGRERERRRGGSWQYKLQNNQWNSLCILHIIAKACI